MSHELFCRCRRCERDRDWQAYMEPDWREDDLERRDQDAPVLATTDLGRTI